MTRTITNPGFSAKAPAEIITVAFEFVNLTSAPITPVVTSARHSGTADASPSAILSGAAQISGTQILQKIIGGVQDTDYLLTCQVDTAGGSRYVLTGILPVRAA